MSKQPRTEGKRGALSVLSQELDLSEEGCMGGVQGLPQAPEKVSIVVKQIEAT